jgi:hypothetical protein
MDGVQVQPDCGTRRPDGTSFCSSPIFGSMSTDRGIRGRRRRRSAVARTLCFFGNFFDPSRNPHDCDFDQGSYSVALPNGDLEVIFNNGNTARQPERAAARRALPPERELAAGTAHLNCASPVKVGDDVVTGRAAVRLRPRPGGVHPGRFIRTNDFPRITKDNTQNNHLYASGRTTATASSTSRSRSRPTAA